jgi:Bacterial Ig-like domain (group 3)
LIGFGHAGFSDCGTSVTGGAGIACTGIEYGDRFSVMGVPKLGHLSVGHKLSAGFLDDAQVPDASAGGTFTVQPLETIGTGLKGLRLPWGGQQLFVEYRKRVGFDANLDASVSTGALFHLGAQLLDLTPTSPRSELNAVLLPGSPAFVVPGVASVAVLSAGTTLRLAVTAVPPLAELKLDGRDGPITGTAPFSTRLSWSGTGACSLGGSGPVAVEGFEDFDLQAGTHTFSLSCTNTRGTTTDQVTVTVLEPTQRPTVALTLNGAEADVVTYTDRTVQAWFSSQLATLGCTRSGAWSGPLALRGDATFAPPSAGTFTFSVRCSNPLGDTLVSRRAVVHAVPQVSLVSPAAGAFVRGPVLAQLSVSDWAAVRGAELFTPNGVVAFVGGQATWDTTALPDGPVTLSARAQRLDWMSELAPSVDVTVDNTAPSGSVTLPTNAFVRGAVTVRATGADALSAVRLQLFVDGVALGSEGAGPTRSVSWDTRALPSGSQHTLQALVKDAAGNQAWTAARTVTVDNAPATMTVPVVSATSAPSLVVRWQTNEDARATVQFGLSGLTSSRSPSGYRRDHAVALTGLTAGATYVLRAKSTDRAGNVTLAPEVAFRLP